MDGKRIDKPSVYCRLGWLQLLIQLASANPATYLPFVVSCLESLNTYLHEIGEETLHAAHIYLVPTFSSTIS